MNRKTQKWIINIALAMWIFLGGMVAFLIYDEISQAIEETHQTCRNERGHRVPCE